ncbi:MAG TPA: DNA-formamidopyrimidine glycosylase family protein [Acidimicrobiales bacterium]|nr:DNA-formamidopyrimidine glycosylase family protein [Acidimicrobiales bacterium]
MPELVEVERYRTLAAGRALDRTIEGVAAPDAWYLKRGAQADLVRDVLVGERFVAARRRGKLLMLDVSNGVVMGLHFGMSGRLLVDGRAGVDQLLYSPAGDQIRYDRFTVAFADGGVLTVRDPRRLGGVELEPDESRLGPDALTATLPELRRALSGAAVALKARLLDQSKLAGVGNLIADEVLWRAGLSPLRPAGELPAAAVKRLHGHLGSGLADLIGRGGSHTGDLMPERRPGGMCPRDGTPLVRATVGGRTTWWCPRHQR